MRDAIAYAIFRAAGVPAPRTAYVELTFTVPGVYQNTPAGLFTLIEDVNKKFLERALPPGTGLLMKPEGMRGGVQSMGDDVGVVHADLPARSRRDAARAAARDGVRAARLSARRRPLPRQDRRPISTSISFSVSSPSTRSSSTRDSYLRGGHNFYLYLDPKDDKFRFIPWDQDLSMGSRWADAAARGRTARRDAPVHRRPAPALLAAGRSRERRAVSRHRPRAGDVGIHGRRIC